MSKLALVVFVAAAAIATAAQDSNKVVYHSAPQMKADLDKAPANDIGESEINLIEHISDQHAAILLRRTKPGKAEIHTNEADVWYVINGGCVLIVGGTEIGGKQESPGQIRGTAIFGGTEYKLAKGDVIRIPHGVPHWVKHIEGGELVYIVMKYADK
jgi:mannose-6-phosphate isomerase-like protein (cupin superfamily)